MQYPTAAQYDTVREGDTVDVSVVLPVYNEVTHLRSELVRINRSLEVIAIHLGGACGR